MKERRIKGFLFFYLSINCKREKEKRGLKGKIHSDFLKNYFIIEKIHKKSFERFKRRT